jgi:hypothetical protein
MKPLKIESDALAAVMMTPLGDFLTEREAAEHKDPEGLAQKRMFTRAIEAVDAVRGERTSWVVVVRFGVVASSVTYQSFGAWSTKAQAEKAAMGILAAVEGTAYAVVPQRTPEGWESLLQQADAPPAEKSMWAEVRLDAIAFRRGWKPQKTRREQHLDKV